MMIHEFWAAVKSAPRIIFTFFRKFPLQKSSTNLIRIDLRIDLYVKWHENIEQENKREN